jgi:membrane-bound metal-dependent hydrolase YbcI (DUF457 family)
MPVTPFHFGPGGLVAVASRKSVSFLSFCAANVLIDVESLYNMVTHQPRIHTFLHTYLGSSLAAALLVVLFIPARRAALALPGWTILAWRKTPLRAIAFGAALGAWSHVFLDSIMHADITPWAPLSEANALYRVVSLRALHLGCLAAGLAALGWWILGASTASQRDGDRP